MSGANSLLPFRAAEGSYLLTGEAISQYGIETELDDWMGFIQEDEVLNSPGATPGTGYIPVCPSCPILKGTLLPPFRAAALIGCYLNGNKADAVAGYRVAKMLQNKSASTGAFVPDICTSKGCKMAVPAGLAAERMCILHFTLFIEQECAEMRRESALGKNSHERHNEFMQRIAGRGETLVKVATSGYTMSDEIKARILSTLLTLMNCRENIDRAAMRQSASRRFVG